MGEIADGSLHLEDLSHTDTAIADHKLRVPLIEADACDLATDVRVNRHRLTVPSRLYAYAVFARGEDGAIISTAVPSEALNPLIRAGVRLENNVTIAVADDDGRLVCVPFNVIRDLGVITTSVAELITSSDHLTPDKAERLLAVVAHLTNGEGLYSLIERHELL
jgi:hypothetical protein